MSVLCSSVSTSLAAQCLNDFLGRDCREIANFQPKPPGTIKWE